ncbi:putative transporter [Novispirillum sp. DQ9]|uniref:putative transporter n=1 Tax=Novispirillum sp. DQ9 TaxID=3398612 RepID=UPI003C7A4668
MFTEVLSGFSPVVQAILALCLTGVLGLALGSVRVRGIGLGVGGVLFAGIGLGQLGIGGDREVMEFLKEFGLILFVYTIGVQVGPGFFAALRRTGLGLNLMAASIVGLGLAMTIAIHIIADIPAPVALGLFSGAVTNTPSLAAGQQMLQEMGASAAQLAGPGAGYAVAYPFGIAGILLTMFLIRFALRIDPAREAAAFEAERRASAASLDTLNVRITNANIDGLALSDVPGVSELGIVVTRILRDGHVRVPHDDTVVHLGDVLLIVGPPRKLTEMRLILGETADVNLKSMDTDVRWERLVVTNSRILGRSVGLLDLHKTHDVVISRVNRAGVELVPSSSLHLQFGDILTVIGAPDDLRRAAQLLGNSEKMLQQAQILPIFLGIALGVLVGSIPIALPGLPAPVKLGLAGGPLVVALVLSRLGHVGPLVWFMPPSANHALREIGIVLFLAVVGLNAGPVFFDVLLNGDGLQWMAWAALITLVPLIIVGVYARLVRRQNYLTLCGLLAGSMTDPPALAFANAVAPSEAAALAYATVYPLVMCLRILAAQILVLVLWAL